MLNFEMNIIVQLNSTDDDSKQLLNFPNLYLANYFSELKNSVDKNLALKLIMNEHDSNKKDKLKQIWIQMIEKINKFEAECLKNAKNGILPPKSLEIASSFDESDKDFINQEKLLFLNKTIFLMNNESSNALLDIKLIIINDECISSSQLKQRFALSNYIYLFTSLSFSTHFYTGS